MTSYNAYDTPYERPFDRLTREKREADERNYVCLGKGNPKDPRYCRVCADRNECNRRYAARRFKERKKKAHKPALKPSELAEYMECPQRFFLKKAEARK